MSLLTQLLHVFLGAPLSTTPITFILVHFFTQLFSSFRSTCPNHLNLPLCILFSTHSMPKRFKSSSLRFLSFKDTPHILLTIILSALLNLARSSAFIAQVSLPYTNTLCTQASYIFPKWIQIASHLNWWVSLPNLVEICYFLASHAAWFLIIQEVPYVMQQNLLYATITWHYIWIYTKFTAHRCWSRKG